MKSLIERLCAVNGASGREERVREAIIGEIDGFCEYKTDALGNLICFKKGKKRPKHRILLDAHMDEVGIIVTGISDRGFVSFACVGGIDASVLLAKRVEFENGASGVIGVTPVHLLSGEEREYMPPADSMYVDIGASSKEQAQKLVRLGETGVFAADFAEMGASLIRSKALDDRVGCAVLIDMLRGELEYDMYFSFSVQEEVGLRGAGAVAYSVAPQRAIIIETTTAADLPDVAEHKQVCRLSQGAAVSFMDRSTLYPRELYDKAFEVAGKFGIKAQPKTLVAGGNNAGAIHKTGAGAAGITLSVPCRYLHSPSCVCDMNDVLRVRRLAQALSEELCR